MERKRKMGDDLHLEVTIECDTEAEMLRIGNQIHHCLVGSPNYIDSRIVLNMSPDRDDGTINTIKLYVGKEAELEPDKNDIRFELFNVRDTVYLTIGDILEKYDDPDDMSTAIDNLIIIGKDGIQSESNDSMYFSFALVIGADRLYDHIFKQSDQYKLLVDTQVLNHERENDNIKVIIKDDDLTKLTMVFK